jgi:hypothetical protein
MPDSPHPKLAVSIFLDFSGFVYLFGDAHLIYEPSPNSAQRQHILILIFRYRAR